MQLITSDFSTLRCETQASLVLGGGSAEYYHGGRPLWCKRVSLVWFGLNQMGL